jgi:hypothetical protein
MCLALYGGMPGPCPSTRDKPLSDTKQMAAWSAMQLSRIKMIQHSNTVTLHGCCIPIPEDVQDYVDAGHHETCLHTPWSEGLVNGDHRNCII